MHDSRTCSALISKVFSKTNRHTLTKTPNPGQHSKNPGHPKSHENRYFRAPVWQNKNRTDWVGGALKWVWKTKNGSCGRSGRANHVHIMYECLCCEDTCLKDAQCMLVSHNYVCCWNKVLMCKYKPRNECRVIVFIFNTLTSHNNDDTYTALQRHSVPWRLQHHQLQVAYWCAQNVTCPDKIRITPTWASHTDQR